MPRTPKPIAEFVMAGHWAYCSFSQRNNRRSLTPPAMPPHARIPPHHGYALVARMGFFAEQLGLPVPSMPLLLARARSPGPAA